jgi:hypothetical protein
MPWGVPVVGTNAGRAQPNDKDETRSTEAGEGAASASAGPRTPAEAGADDEVIGHRPLYAPSSATEPAGNAVGETVLVGRVPNRRGSVYLEMAGK